MGREIVKVEKVGMREVEGILNHLSEMCNKISSEKGWNDEPRSFGDLIALLHSEASEALEEFRDGRMFNETYYDPFDTKIIKKPEGIPSELADVLIRVFQMCGALDIDIGAAFVEKCAFNRTRPRMHGGKVI